MNDITYNDINILYEDNHLLVVMKPQGVPCQADQSGDKDMLTLLKEYLVETYNKHGEAYLGLVHRLDRMTGGVMVFAKSSKAAARLSEQIRDGETEKRYMCLVEGTPSEKAKKLTCYLKKFAELNVVKIVPQLTEGAKYAELDYKLLETRDNMSLLLVNLVTGRGHQIRVQMAGMGNPIVGDCRYGNGEKLQLKLPLCLWACELRFTHPISGKSMVFRVFPPEEEPWTRFDVASHLNIAIKNN